MRLRLDILDETDQSTVSELRNGDELICYVIEDAGRDGNKVPGETRIPAGTYPVVPRKAGGFYERYGRRWGHEFVPWITKVPNFTWILIHLGNTHKDTRGCLLPATEYHRASDGHYWGKDSTSAYLKLYALLRKTYADGEAVEIIVNRDYPEPPSEEEEIADEPTPKPVPDSPVTEPEPKKPTGFCLLLPLLAALISILAILNIIT